ncbi:MAG: radical SAM protein [Acidobacteriota bacterium]
MMLWNQLATQEQGAVRKNHGGKFRFALCYPNFYSIGMANLGFHYVYAALNAEPDCVCERAFIPMAPDSRRAGLPRRPLTTVESETPVCNFDVLAFSISFETDFVHVPEALRLAHLPPLRSERNSRHPLVVFGGAAMMLNPEPVADFADVILLGDGEELVPELLEALRSGLDKEGVKAWLHEKPGCYVPERHLASYEGRDITTLFGSATPKASRSGVQSRFDHDLSLRPPHTEIFTPNTEMGDKFLIEVSRGCPLGCRFCWVGFTYLPPRTFSAASLLAAAAAARRFTRKIGLVATAVCDHPGIHTILSQLREMEYQISVSSLRMDHITPEFIHYLVSSGEKSIAIAPEVGSDRLRTIVNKNVSNDQIVQIARTLFQQGILNLKLYFMVGLPGETDQDVDAIATLVGDIKAVVLEHGRKSGRLGNLIISLNCFVPKPNTPFQWAAMESEETLKARIERVRQGLRPISNVILHAPSPREELIQGVLSRGDRRLSSLLLHMDGNLSGWKKAAREISFPVMDYLGERTIQSILPWEMIDVGLDKSFLARDYAKSQAVQATAPCPNVPSCERCGICETPLVNPIPSPQLEVRN